MTLCMSQSFTVWNFLLVAWIFFSFGFQSFGLKMLST